LGRCNGAKLGSLYNKDVGLRWMVYHDQQGVHYDGYASVGDGNYQHIVHLDQHQAKVQAKDTKWAGRIIDPNDPIQTGPEGGKDQARVRVDGSDDSVDFGTPVIIPLNTPTSSGGGYYDDYYYYY
jgi:hypothetical protein